MLADWFLRRRIVYPAAAIFCFQFLLPDFALAQRRGEPPRPPVQLAEAPPAYEEAKRQIDKVVAAAEETRKAIDRANFDPAARAAAIGPKIQDLFLFVRDQIAYHPYPGVLRFAEGTLMSRAGNSCDKSLLLAAMLRHHGHKVRFARAKLDERVARALVEFSDRPPAADSRGSLGLELRRTFADVLRRAGAPASEIEEATREDDRQFEAFRAALAAGADYNADELSLVLERAGVFGRAPADAAAVVEAARDHCWVQIEARGSWYDLDPSAYRIEAGDRIAERGEIGDALPADLYFKLRFVVTAEKAEGGKVEPIVVLDHTTPLLQAVNRIGLSFVPENVARTNAVGVADAAQLRNFTVAWPVLSVNEKATAGDPFDLAGRKLARNPQERLGSTIGRGFGNALGGSTASELRRVKLSLTVTGPGGLEKRFERELARRAAGPKDKAELNLRAQLLGSFELVAAGSRFDEGYVAAAALDGLVASRSLLDHLAKVERGLAKAGDFDRKALPRLGFGEALAYLLYRSNLVEARGQAAAPNVIAFAAEPQIVVYRRRALPGTEDRPRLAEGYDIVVNALRVYDDLQRPKETPSQAFAFRVAQGIVDTLLEYVLMGGGAAFNVHPVMVAARNRDGDRGLILIRPQEAAAVDRLPVAAGDRAAMKQDLERGFAIVAPAKPVDLDGQARFAWWRVNLETGETLGLGSLGEGQTMSELITIGDIGFLGAGLLSCALFAEIPDMKSCITVVVVEFFIVLALNFTVRILARMLESRAAAAAAREAGRRANAPTAPLPGVRPPRPPRGVGPTGTSVIPRPPGPPPSVAPPVRRGPGDTQNLPWIHGRGPGDTQKLPWLRGPGDTQKLPWIQ